MNAQLLDLSARYTDRYPDVLVLKDKIAKTEKLRDQLIAEAKLKQATKAPLSRALSWTPQTVHRRCSCRANCKPMNWRLVTVSMRFQP